MATFTNGDRAALNMPDGTSYSGYVEATADPTVWTFVFDDTTQPNIDFGADRLSPA